MRRKVAAMLIENKGKRQLFGGMAELGGGVVLIGGLKLNAMEDGFGEGRRLYQKAIYHKARIVVANQQKVGQRRKLDHSNKRRKEYEVIANDQNKALLTVGNAALANPGWTAYANYCFAREKGLRKEAFRQLDNFLLQLKNGPESKGLSS